MMYDLLYFYNQFIGPLPDTYEQFTHEWNSRFPSTFDTKVLSFKADYFGKTVLGKVYEKCQEDKRLKDILGFCYDDANGFVNYMGSSLQDCYHEAAFDAMMTGYVFAKILKYKEIDEIYHKNRQDKKVPKSSEKKDKDKDSTDPALLRDTQLDISHHFFKSNINKVMMNQFDNCCCFGLDPAKPDKASAQSAEKHPEIIWMEFKEELEADDLSAETISHMFSNFGDFHVFKDTSKSCILNFYYFDKNFVEEKSV
jgi:hypothetical protein